MSTLMMSETSSAQRQRPQRRRLSHNDLIPPMTVKDDSMRLYGDDPHAQNYTSRFIRRASLGGSSSSRRRRIPALFSSTKITTSGKKVRFRTADALCEEMDCTYEYLTRKEMKRIWYRVSTDFMRNECELDKSLDLICQYSRQLYHYPHSRKETTNHSK